MLAHRLRITNPQDYGLYPMSAASAGKHIIVYYEIDSVGRGTEGPRGNGARSNLDQSVT